MAQSILPIRIRVEPKASHRERYLCEIDCRRNRSLRFIRADTNSDHLDYPTIEIPRQWNSQRLYIRVTLVTVWSEQVPVTCVHPYPIDTRELNVIKDAERNTLYFPVSEEELKNGRKSFRIILRKLTQHELRNYGPLYLLNKDVRDIQRTSNSHDARKLMDVYQLERSQLVFSIAELVSDRLLPVIYDATSAYSKIMTAIKTTTTTTDDESFVRCVPQKGNWLGGDEILMVIPKLNKRKSNLFCLLLLNQIYCFFSACQVCFEHSTIHKINHIPVEFVGLKTITFRSPPCPTKNQRMEVPIVVIQNGEEIACVNFVYQSCKQLYF
ncbi:unnamed protein product [Rotaria sp. Silwood2]|nr:unnamed protein product [Rotaria sp. Silwood2]CAF3413300.1 unnamed protein product [Rotaria sp. Silwood2]CAF4400302.1 unnamed protein product [Rotaria sp. Silwood2]CAF4414155.1 unnamed protein product [Rotaria sp. Silwood2]